MFAPSEDATSALKQNVFVGMASAFIAYFETVPVGVTVNEIEVEAGKAMGYVQTYYGMEEVIPAVDGRVVAVCAKQGDHVVKGEIVAFVEK